MQTGLGQHIDVGVRMNSLKTTPFSAKRLKYFMFPLTRTSSGVDNLVDSAQLLMCGAPWPMRFGPLVFYILLTMLRLISALDALISQ